MKILVTGAAGQLGRETVLMLQAAGEEVIGIDREGLDFSRPEEVAEGCYRSHRLVTELHQRFCV